MDILQASSIRSWDLLEAHSIIKRIFRLAGDSDDSGGLREVLGIFQPWEENTRENFSCLLLLLHELGFERQGLQIHYSPRALVETGHKKEPH